MTQLSHLYIGWTESVPIRIKLKFVRSVIQSSKIIDLLVNKKLSMCFYKWILHGFFTTYFRILSRTVQALVRFAVLCKCII